MALRRRPADHDRHVAAARRVELVTRLLADHGVEQRPQLGLGQRYVRHLDHLRAQAHARDLPRRKQHIRGAFELGPMQHLRDQTDRLHRRHAGERSERRRRIPRHRWLRSWLDGGRRDGRLQCGRWLRWLGRGLAKRQSRSPSFELDRQLEARPASHRVVELHRARAVELRTLVVVGDLLQRHRHHVVAERRHAQRLRLAVTLEVWCSVGRQHQRIGVLRLDQFQQRVDDHTDKVCTPRARPQRQPSSPILREGSALAATARHRGFVSPTPCLGDARQKARVARLSGASGMRASTRPLTARRTRD
jgi:hypothetical protein